MRLSKRTARSTFPLPVRCRLTEFRPWSDPDPRGFADASYSDFHDIADPADAEDRSRVYLVPDLLSGSDYSGSSVEAANYREFLRAFNGEETDGEDYGRAVVPGLVELHGGYGTYAVAVPLTSWERASCEDCEPEDPCDVCGLCAEMRETLTALEDYPVIDEQALSEVEMERESEAWASWVRSDFLAELETLHEVEDIDDTARASDVLSVFLAAQDRANVYWVHETGDSCYIDVERVADAVTAEEVTRLTDPNDPAGWPEDAAQQRLAFAGGVL